MWQRCLQYSHFKTKAVLRPFCQTRGASGYHSLNWDDGLLNWENDFLNWGNTFMFSSSPDAGGLPTFPSVSISLPRRLYIFLILADFDLDFNSIQCRIFPAAKIKLTSVSLYWQAWMLGVSEDCSACPNFLKFSNHPLKKWNPLLVLFHISGSIYADWQFTGKRNRSGLKQAICSCSFQSMGHTDDPFGHKSEFLLISVWSALF